MTPRAARRRLAKTGRQLGAGAVRFHQEHGNPPGNWNRRAWRLGGPEAWRCLWYMEADPEGRRLWAALAAFYGRWKASP